MMCGVLYYDDIAAGKVRDYMVDDIGRVGIKTNPLKNKNTGCNTMRLIKEKTNTKNE